MIAGAVGNALVIGMWLVSRTIGAPLGPSPWVPETIGIEDSLSTAFEILIVAGALGFVRGRSLRAPAMSLVRFVSFACLLVLLTGGGIVSASVGGHTHGGGSHPSLGGGHHHSGSPIAPDDPLLQEIKDAVSSGGAVAGLDLLEDVAAQDEEVQALAHQYVHSLGRFVYDSSDTPAAAFSSCDMRFESGCYHGVLQGYFEEHSDFTGQDVSQLCSGPIATDSSKNLKFQCLHGLGHGLSLFFDHNLLRPLRYCDFLVEEWERSSCYGGAFMENIVWAQTVTDPQAGVQGESLIREDPQYPCDALADRYKGTCYFIQSSVFLYLNEFDFSEAFTQCGMAPADYIDFCYMSMGRDIAGYTLQDPDESLDLCLLGEPARLGACLHGVAQTMVNIEATTDEAFRFCALAPRQGQERCYQGIGEFVSSLSYDSGDRKAECSKAGDPRWIDACSKAAGI
jgi:hypothetical protein